MSSITGTRRQAVIRRRQAVDAHGFRWAEDGLGARREIAPDQVEICRKFLSQCEPTQRAGVGSYGLKHIIERAAGSYISNGSCIAAAIDLGFRVAPAHSGYNLFAGKFWNPRPVNGWVHISRPSVRKVSQAYRAARLLADDNRADPNVLVAAEAPRQAAERYLWGAR